LNGCGWTFLHKQVGELAVGGNNSEDQPQTAAEEQRLIAEIGRVVSSSPDLDAVFSAFTELARKLIPFDRLAISTVHPETRLITDAHISGLETDELNVTGPYTLADSALPSAVYEDLEVVAVSADRLKKYADADATRDNAVRISAGLISAMFAPLVLQGRLVGSLVFRSKQADPYDDREVELAQQITAQIAGVISANQQVELLAKESHERQRLAEERATIAEIGRIVGSTLDFDEVLSRFATQAKLLVPHDRVVITTWPDDGTTLVDRYVEGIEVEGFGVGQAARVPKDFIWHRLHEEKKPFLVNGEKYVEFKDRNDLERARYAAGLRAGLIVPLLLQGRVIGSIAFRSTDPDAFDEHQVELAVSVAAQIAGAVAAAEQLRIVEDQSAERQRLAEEQARIAEIGRIVSSTLDIGDVLAAFVEQARSLVPFDRIVVTVFDEDRAEVTDVLVDGLNLEKERIGNSYPISQSNIQANVILNQEARVANGASYRELAETSPAEKLRYDIGSRSLLMIPLVWQGRPVGSLNLRSKNSHAYGDRQLELAEQIAAQIAGAIATSNQYRLLEQAAADNELLAAALQAADDAIIIRDADTKVVYVNSGFEKQTGFSSEEVVGTDFLYPEHDGGNVESLYKLWDRLRQGESWRSVVSSTHKDGTEYIVDASLTPIFNDAGEVDKFLGVRRDVTERIRAEENNRIQAAALEATGDAVVILNPDTSIEWVNEAFVRATGYTREEAIGQRSPFLRSDKDPDRTFDEMWEKVRSGKPGRTRLWTRRKDGTDYPVDTTLTPVFDDEGNISRFIGVRRDITDLLQAEKDREATRDLDAQNKQLLELNEQREEFFSTVSHELRTPLTSVMAFADILSRDRDGTLTNLQREHLDVIKRNSRNLSNLVEDMLDFSRMSTDQLRLDKSEFEVHSLLDWLVESLEPTASLREQSLLVEPHTGPIWVNADYSRLVQILSNLITNSCKYSPASTRISVSVGYESGFVSLSVTDQGVGIPPGDIENIYSPFFRSNQHEVREEIGTGLGLAISKTLVDLHGGTINAKSVVDHGTTITVTLPGASPTPTVNAKA
jgi:PAS domain S-box-containing protein